MTDIARFLPNNEYQAAVNANAPTAANPFATVADLSGLGGETLAQTLANGNITGANDIEISNSQVIKAENGNSSIDLRFSGTDGKIGLLGDFFEATMGTFFVDDAIGSVVANTSAATLSLFKGNLSKLGQITIGYNDGLDVSSGSLPSYPTILSSQSSTVKDGVINSNILGGLGVIAKTDNTPYGNQFGFNAGEAFETILDYTTATQENTATLQDASGTIAYLSDLSGGGGIYGGNGSLIGNTTVTQVDNSLTFSTSLNANALKIAGGTGFIGIGTSTPGNALHVAAGDAFVQNGALGVGEAPDPTQRLRVTQDDTLANATCIRTDNSYITQTGNFSGLQVRSTTSKSGASSTLFGINSNITGGATAGVHTFYGVRGRAVSTTGGTATVTNIGGVFEASGGDNNHAIQILDGSQGVGKVLTSDASGNGTWQAAGGTGPSLRNVTSTDTFATANETINCTSGTFTVNLPTAVGIQGTTYTLVNSGVGVITLDGNGAETIQGSATVDLTTQISIRVQSDGTNWIII